MYTNSTDNTNRTIKYMNKINYTPVGRDCIYEIEIPKSVLIQTEEQKLQALIDKINNTDEGVILRIGKDCSWVKEGDLVKFGTIHPFIITVEDKKYVQISETDIKGIITK